MRAIYCKSCRDIIYSMDRHDFKSCTCGACNIDDFGHRIGFRYDSCYVDLDINEEFMLKNLLQQAYRQGGTLTISLGRLRLKHSSNIGFYKQFIKNFEDFRIYFEEVTYAYKGENQG